MRVRQAAVLGAALALAWSAAGAQPNPFRLAANWGPHGLHVDRDGNI